MRQGALSLKQKDEEPKEVMEALLTVDPEVVGSTLERLKGVPLMKFTTPYQPVLMMLTKEHF